MLKKKKQECLKIGLALSGGSALGIAHIGAIKALRENKIPLHCVAGTSAGAIVATALAFGVPLEKMIELSCRLSWSNISEFGYSKLGLNSNWPVGEIMIKLVGDKKIEDAPIPLAIIATDIDTGEKIVFRKGSVADAVRASTCLPGFFIPTKIKGKRLVDGGLVENLPLSPLRKMGADVRIGVDLGHFRTLKKTHNILDVITNSYNILIKPQENILVEDAEVLIEPHLEKFHSTDFKKADELNQAGYQATKLKIPQIKKYLGRKIKPESKSFWQKWVDFFGK